MGLFGLGKKQGNSVKLDSIQQEVISDLVKEGELSMKRPFDYYSNPDKAKITKEVNLRLQGK